MKATILVLLAVFASACVSNARIETLEKRLAASEEQNRRLRILQLEADDAESADSTPQADTAAAPGLSGAQASTGAMWVRQSHGVYMGAVGAVPRQVTMGPKIAIRNLVCDRGSRNTMSRCIDLDGIGGPDTNTWLAFEIDYQPVICDSGFIHPEAQVSLVRPGQTCYVEFGGSRTVDLKIMAYRNSGTATYVMLDSAPYATWTETVSARNRNIVDLKIDEKLMHL